MGQVKPSILIVVKGNKHKELIHSAINHLANKVKIEKDKPQQKH